MSVPLDPELPQNVAQLATPHGPLVLLNFDDRLGASASQWNRKELVAFRTRILLPLRDDHDQSCPNCRPENSSSQQVHLHMLQQVRTRFSGLRTASESFLYSLPTGRFRLALARLIRSDVQDEERTYSTREGAGNRQAAHYPGFIPSSTIPIPESSSPARPSSSEYSGSHTSVPLDDDQNETRARKPEVLMAKLAKELFSLSLYSVLKQPHPKEEYYFRPESHSLTALITSTAIISANDGGLYKKRLLSSS
ncbi:hypothetical protein BM221_001137 [Beauveria bassiana]|uniref:Uncharacterized protein n=1 Tax=Beauveria bassiana TaxID=176275 RepID=A0A2N6P2H1_BEABA|nr:hypothetical protein BM221_001137 [Beauveria bassiana]